MQYMITAYDGTDDNALNRRMNARPRHLENIAKVKEYCNIVSAGGILDDNGKMIGSFLIMDFAAKDDLDKYLKSEPYIKEKVWETVKIEPCNVVIQNNEKIGK